MEGREQRARVRARGRARGVPTEGKEMCIIKIFLKICTAVQGK